MIAKSNSSEAGSSIRVVSKCLHLGPCAVYPEIPSAARQTIITYGLSFQSPANWAGHKFLMSPYSEKASKMSSWAAGRSSQLFESVHRRQLEDGCGMSMGYCIFLNREASRGRHISRIQLGPTILLNMDQNSREWGVPCFEGGPLPSAAPGWARRLQGRLSNQNKLKTS